ncbi:MAG: ABC transporter substrate-binding protein [Candidatus Competibacteraceae bacterium]|nr:ABC transporter substrate-binding protein [Candidatus Competibacteraceae bacterium]MCP5132653.1 ABC transporter substrate-binding protein [Gammaproteobacteria bacterium]
MKSRSYPKIRLHPPENSHYQRTSSCLLNTIFLAGWLAAFASNALAQDFGVSNTTVRIGGVMALEGPLSGLGQNMKIGIDAAIKGAAIQGRTIEFAVLNDSYNPPDTIEATHKLLGDGVFAMVGNVGTPTAQVALPILAEQKIPAVGFFSGANLLRPGVGAIINFRPSYSQEIAAVIEAALRAGVKPNQICAFVQNDSYGMAGVTGIIMTLGNQPGAAEIITKLEQIRTTPDESPERNNVGPVGVYPRNTVLVRDGYKSLKQWEKTTGERCRLVVTVGTYEPIAQFMAYARKLKREPWIISAVSLTGAESLQEQFRKYDIREDIIMTQVVPALDSPLPIVESARKALGSRLGYIPLEGYIVGKMFLTILDKAGNAPTRERFIEAARGRKFDLGGLTLDFTNDNQGSDFVLLTLLQGDDFKVIEPNYVEKLFTQ